MTSINNSYTCVFHYSRAIDDLCRNCDGKRITCENYVPQIQKLIRTNHNQISKNEMTMNGYIPMIVRSPRKSSLLQKTLDMIRRYNDDGAI